MNEKTGHIVKKRDSRGLKKTIQDFPCQFVVVNKLSVFVKFYFGVVNPQLNAANSIMAL